MKSNTLANKRVACVATDGFEESELLEPKKALEEAGAQVHVISTHPGKIKAWKGKDWSEPINVDKGFKDVKPEDYDALFLPGGVINADHLRIDQGAVAFVRHFAESGKPIAAICHGAWILIETGQVRNHTMTSWPSLKTDLENAGAIWVDKEVVSENGWVTSRKPQDIPAFNKKMIEEFKEGRHGAQKISA